MSTKTKLLQIAKHGVFNTFTPPQLARCREQLLALTTDSLSSLEMYALLELQFYISLLTDHDVEAKACLDRLVDQFEPEKSQRLKVLQSIYLEAVGEEAKAQLMLSLDPDELELSRRLTTFSRNNGDTAAYISNLVFYLDLNPSDIKTWAELADQYLRTGNYDRAIYCYKEVLLQEPFAYNIFYQCGLQHYKQFLQLDQQNGARERKEKVLEAVEQLTRARHNFLRSTEICQDYAVGWLAVAQIGGLADFHRRIEAKYGTVKEVRAFLDDTRKLQPAVLAHTKQ